MPPLDQPLNRLGEGHLRRLLEAGRTLASVNDVDDVLRHMLEASREVTGARYAAIGVFNRDHTALERFLTNGMDAETEARIGERPVGRGLLLERAPMRLDDLADHPRGVGFPPNHPPMTSFLGMPIHVGRRAIGNLYLTDKNGGEPFTETDELAIEVLADWAALALERARAGVRERLTTNVAGMEAERRRWSRELHDETLQGLGAIRVLLATGLRSGDPAVVEATVTDALGQLSDEIQRLRGLITDLRPAALDELGLASALEAVVRSAELRDHVQTSLAVALAFELGIENRRLSPELENAIYRIVQESLRNAGRHAKASTISVSVIERDDEVTVRVEDDGVGFDPDAPASGFGVQGLRERAALLEGTLGIDSHPGSGTIITARLPVRRAPEPQLPRIR